MVVTFGLMALMPQVERMAIPFVLIYGTSFLFTELGECDNLDLSVGDISGARAHHRTPTRRGAATPCSIARALS